MSSYYMDVSENSGTPQIIHLNQVFHYKSSVLGVPLFLETPIYLCRVAKPPEEICVANSPHVLLASFRRLSISERSGLVHK